MSKALRKIGTVAGAVALVATGVGAVAGAGALASTATSVATIATVTATAAGIGAQLLQKPPRARGGVTQAIIQPDAPQPYMMGEGYFGGVVRYDNAYGPTLDKVPNPYRAYVMVYSGSGPAESITPYVDKKPVTSWYSGWLYTDTQLGETPEASALSPNFAGMPGWDASSKLSGQAAILWNLRFDKKGKRFASGVPHLGAYGKWVKVYDPRQDDTFPGGSGSHRLGDESTYEWSENPALHAGMYTFGRYQNGKRVFGVGMDADAIDWSGIAAWANVCEVNDWSIFGVIFEPGDRWQNLKDIAMAGGAQPVVSAGGLLGFRYFAPQVPLDTISADDLADGNVTITAMQSWGERLNTIVPKYISEEHEWQMVAAEAVSVSTYVDEDGEEKTKEWPFNCVKSVDQASQLAAYQILDARELSPIVVPCNPRMRHYRPGECLQIDLPDYGLTTPAVILQRDLDPETMTVTLTLVGETPSKHDFALGRIGTPPATPAVGQTPQERDELAWGAANGETEVVLIAQSYTQGATITGTDAGSDASVTVSAHERIYGDGKVAVDEATLTELSFATTYSLYYDDPTREGGPVVIVATTNPDEAFPSSDHPARHNVGAITTPADGGADTTGYPTLPPGWNFYFPVIPF